MKSRLSRLFLLLLSLSACNQTANDDRLVVSLVVDGRETAYQQDTPITVGEFLRGAEIELGALDEVNPPEFSQLTDGMRVTVVRVVETTECERQEIARRVRRVLNEGLSPGEERLGQAGQNGIEEICYRILARDGQREAPIPVSRTLISAPQDEVIYVGPASGEVDPVPIEGTLAYISNGNAWIMRESSTTKRVITQNGDLDGRVFTLSAEGRQLLFSRETSGSARETFFNRLWLINDTTIDADPVALLPENVLYASWIPNQPNAISYSTGEIASGAPGWNAFNDLWILRIDPASGTSLNLDQLVERSTGGLYGWWGTHFAWSPDGTRLAWARADRVGLVDLTTGALNEESPLLTYEVFNTNGPWSWRAELSWSADSDLLLTTTHGSPIGSEPPQTSPAFDVTAVDIGGTFAADIVVNAGIWSAPKFADQRMAYLRARDLSNSISESAEYDLVVADRDGSNAEIIFPDVGLPGLTRDAITFTWSPDGDEIAFIYDGNLWVIDVASRISHQLTLDGGASRPVWTE
jgi:hypothetical protein